MECQVLSTHQEGVRGFAKGVGTGIAGTLRSCNPMWSFGDMR